MRRKMFLGAWMAGLVLFFMPAPMATGKELSEKEILALLPAGSVIASVRPRPYEAGGKTARKKTIMQVQWSNQGNIKTIVGYYTEPDRRGEEQTATYYRRVHVALLARKNNAIKVLWDSGGWGFEFGMELIEDTYTDTQLLLFFGLRDLNADGQDELVISARTTIEYKTFLGNPKLIIVRSNDQSAGLIRSDYGKFLKYIEEKQKVEPADAGYRPPAAGSA